MVQTHKTYGLLTALAIIIINVILYVAGLAFTEQWTSYVAYVPFIIGIILNAIAFSKANDHNVKFGQVFSSGFKACAIITLISIAWSLLSIYVVFPEMKDKALEIAAEQMYKNPDMKESDIETALNMTKKFFVPFMIAGIVFGYMFFGAIFSLIGAAVAKKNPQAA